MFVGGLLVLCNDDWHGDGERVGQRERRGGGERGEREGGGRESGEERGRQKDGGGGWGIERKMREGETNSEKGKCVRGERERMKYKGQIASTRSLRKRRNTLHCMCPP